MNRKLSVAAFIAVVLISVPIYQWQQKGQLPLSPLYLKDGLEAFFTIHRYYLLDSQFLKKHIANRGLQIVETGTNGFYYFGMKHKFDRNKTTVRYEYRGRLTNQKSSSKAMLTKRSIGSAK